MKNLFYLVIAALFVSGCTYKNEAVNLHSYKADYIGPSAAQSKKVYIQSVQDTRLDKRSIGAVISDGKKLTTLYSDVNFAEKYREGLGYALNIARFYRVDNVEDASLIMDVYIKDIDVVYYDKGFEENLKGAIEIEVVVRRGDETFTQKFRQKGGKWISPSYSSKNVEPFLYSLFSDSINDIVSKLTRY